MQFPASSRSVISATFAGLSIAAPAATVVPITDVFRHDEKTNFGGVIEDMINGSGMNGNDGTGSVTCLIP